MRVLIVMLTFMLIKVYYAAVRVLKLSEKFHAYWWECKRAPAWKDTVAGIVHVCVWLSPGVSQSVIITRASHLSRAEAPSIEIMLMEALMHSLDMNTWIVHNVWCFMWQEILH